MLTVDIYGWLDAGWEESEHPRGQRENKGEFASKASASKASGASAHLQPAHGERSQWPAHIQALRIPPAWTNVQVSHDPEADLLATGQDVKGRKQYVYHQRFAESNAARKFDRIHELSAKHPMIELQNERNRKSPDARVRDLADAAALIMRMGVRPGSDEDTKAATKAYGATTLEGRHVVKEGGKLALRFTGKAGVLLDLPVDDPSLARMLTTRAHAAGPNGRLFAHANANALLDYVHQFNGGGFKTKDFRTLLGTRTAHELVGKLPAPKSVKEYKTRVREVAKRVAQRLGNTPTIALQSYIAPQVFASWRQMAGV